MNKLSLHEFLFSCIFHWRVHVVIFLTSISYKKMNMPCQNGKTEAKMWVFKLMFICVFVTCVTLWFDNFTHSHKLYSKKLCLICFQMILFKMIHFCGIIGSLSQDMSYALGENCVWIHNNILGKPCLPKIKIIKESELHMIKWGD